MLSWMAVDCPTCSSKKGQKCRTLKTGKSTDTHVLRVDRWEELKRRNREKRIAEEDW